MYPQKTRSKRHEGGYNTYQFSCVAPNRWEIVLLTPTDERIPHPPSSKDAYLCASELEAFERAALFAAEDNALIANASIPDQLYRQACACPELGKALSPTPPKKFCGTGLSLLRQAQALSSQSADYDTDHPLSRWFGNQATGLYRAYDEHVHGWKVGDIKVTMSGSYAKPDPKYLYALYRYTDAHMFELFASNALLVDVVKATLGCFRYEYSPYPYQIQLAWDRAGLYRKKQEQL